MTSRTTLTRTITLHKLLYTPGFKPFTKYLNWKFIVQNLLSLIVEFFDIRKLAEYFQDLDVVPSDLAAGLVLLRKQQKRQEHQALVRAIEEQQVLDSQVCKQS